MKCYSLFEQIGYSTGEGAIRALPPLDTAHQGASTTRATLADKDWPVLSQSGDEPVSNWLR